MIPQVPSWHPRLSGFVLNVCLIVFGFLLTSPTAEEGVGRGGEEEREEGGGRGRGREGRKSLGSMGRGEGIGDKSLRTRGIKGSNLTF